MKEYINRIFLLCLAVIACTACKEDTASDSPYVKTFEIHLPYGIFGTEIPYSQPLVITLTNNSEQISYTKQTDKWGKLTLEKLLPGEYTINATGALSADEVAQITGEEDAKAANLVAFLSNVNLRINEEPQLNDLKLVSSLSSTLIFKELYYSGSRTPSSGTYRNDGFYSVYNNSTQPVLLNNLYIGNVEHYGAMNSPGPLWPNEEQGNYKNVYIRTLWKVVAGNEAVMLNGGESIVIAVMAAPHNKDEQFNLNSPVDLSKADYEAYSNDPANNYTDYDTPNMRLVFWPDYGYLWRISVFGQGMVLISASAEEVESFETVTLPETFQDPFEDEEYWLCKKVPLKYVIDAVDLIQNATSTNTKRFPPALDSGFATTDGIYMGRSVIRKVKSTENGVIIYQDTNNSTDDFEINEVPLSK